MSDEASLLNPRPASHDADGGMFHLYNWGGRMVGMALVIVACVLGAYRLTGRPLSSLAGLADVVLIALWSIPVLSCGYAGVRWLQRRPADIVGWIAVGITIFLAGIWIFVDR